MKFAIDLYRIVPFTAAIFIPVEGVPTEKL